AAIDPQPLKTVSGGQAKNFAAVKDLVALNPQPLEVKTVGLSLNDTVRINHKIPLSQSGIIPVGSSVHDTMPINHSKIHALETALTGFDIDINDPKHLLTDSQKAQIKEDMVQAGKAWMDHIDNPNHVPINIQINISDDVPDTQIANARPAYTASTGGPNATTEPAVEYKLQHGGDAKVDASVARMSDGAPADVIININAHQLNNLNLKPQGKDAADKGDIWSFLSHLADSNKIKMTSVLAHEFGHGLGIGDQNALDLKPGTFNGSEKTTWESLLDIQKSGTTFTGSHAEQEHGGPVVVTTNTDGENYQHFGNSVSDVTDP